MFYCMLHVPKEVSIVSWDGSPARNVPLASGSESQVKASEKR